MLADVDQGSRGDGLQVAKPHYFHATVDLQEAMDLAGHRLGQSLDFGESLQLACIHIAQQDMNQQ